MNMIDHETMQIMVRIALLRSPEISVELYLMPKHIMDISMSNDIHFDLKQTIKGSASFYCFNHYSGNHDYHHLFLPIVIATETIELI